MPSTLVQGCAAATLVLLTVLREGRRSNFAITPRYDRELKRTSIVFHTGPALTGECAQQAAGTSVSEMWHVTSLMVRGRFASCFISEHARKEIHSVVGALGPGQRILQATVPPRRSSCWRRSRCRGRSSTSFRSCRSTGGIFPGVGAEKLCGRRNPVRRHGARERRRLRTRLGPLRDRIQKRHSHLLQRGFKVH